MEIGKGDTPRQPPQTFGINKAEIFIHMDKLHAMFFYSAL